MQIIDSKRDFTTIQFSSANYSPYSYSNNEFDNRFFNKYSTYKNIFETDLKIADNLANFSTDEACSSTQLKRKHFCNSSRKFSKNQPQEELFSEDFEEKNYYLPSNLQPKSLVQPLSIQTEFYITTTSSSNFVYLQQHSLVKKNTFFSKIVICFYFFILTKRLNYRS